MIYVITDSRSKVEHDNFLIKNILETYIANKLDFHVGYSSHTVWDDQILGCLSVHLNMS